MPPPKDPTELSLLLLGSPDLRVGGAPVRLDRKPVALLAWLAITGEPASRGALGALLWPDSPQAGVNVRKSLWAIRRALGPSAVREVGASRALRLGDVATDVDAFRQALAGDVGEAAGREGVLAAELEAASKLYRGDLLDGFEIGDSEVFDDWLVVQRERLRLLFGRGLARLSELYAADARWEPALASARRRLALDPLDEDADRQVMRLLARSGRRAAALAHFAACRARIQHEVGAEPDAATVALAKAIADGEPAGVPEWDPPHGPATFLARVDEAARQGPEAPDDDGTAVGTAAEFVRIMTPALVDRAPAGSGRMDLGAIARADPADLHAYRLTRLAAWAGPAHRLDETFVSLSVLVDRSPDAGQTRWAPRPETFGSMIDVLAALDDPAIVLLGAPGAGKSTLLRHLELVETLASLRRDDDRVTFYAPLQAFAPDADEAPDAACALAWLARAWRARYPRLTPLPELLAEGRVLLLLDGLNEMPHRDGDAYHAQIGWWRAFLYDEVAGRPGNRAVITCRSLDYSAPLSSAALPVPQAAIAPLSDAQIAAFVHRHAPAEAGAVLAQIDTAARQDLCRTPYFLKMLVDHLVATGDVMADWPAMITSVLRRAAAREVERANPLFAAGERGGVLDARDVKRLIAPGSWRDLYGLPERGPLFPALTTLAWRMQDGHAGADGAHVAVPYDTAMDLIGREDAEDVLRAGEALAILDEDLGRDSLQFRHQLLQEHFAARRLAHAPEPARLATPWRAGDVVPDLAATLAGLGAADALPPAPTSGWEETALQAAAMAADPDAFVRELIDASPVMAGRCAAVLGARISTPVRDAVRAALVARSRARDADLRARLAAGLALGPIGDPRQERSDGPDGPFVLPPFVAVAAGTYRLGRTADGRGRPTAIGAFALARFPVTNAEWACFFASGGYDDLRWWPTDAAAAWRRGDTTADATRASARAATLRFIADPAELERLYEGGHMSTEWHTIFRRRVAMDEDALEAHLVSMYPGGRLAEPRYWRDARFDNPAQPVVGVCWYEASAYARWLAAQTGLPIRLPSEREWEAAARGAGGRAYAFGQRFEPLWCNTSESHVWCPSPIGAFPDGDSPEGISDLTGNVWEWTASAYDPRAPDLVDARGRSAQGLDADPDPSAERRVARGGAWDSPGAVARADVRDAVLAGGRDGAYGLRLACDAG